MTASIRPAILRAARTLGLFRWMRHRHAHELLVLTYHSVTADVADARERHPLVYRNAVSATHFEQQMRHLRRRYTPIGGEALQAALNGDASLPAHAVVVTFDDGLLNNATVALPILKRLGIPAIFFLPTGFVDAASEGTLRRHWSEDLIARLSYRSGDAVPTAEAILSTVPSLPADRRPSAPAQALLAAIEHLKACPPPQRADRLTALRTLLGDAPPPSAFPAAPDGPSLLSTMTWDHARAAADQGITLGGHTVNHESLAALSAEAAATEMTESLQAIADHTDAAPAFFSYPYGRPADLARPHKTVLAEHGCRGGFTQITGFNDASTDPFFLRRVDVSANYSLDMFSYVISGTKMAVDRLVRGRSPSSAEIGEKA